jgi:hypothetical protein
VLRLRPLAVFLSLALALCLLGLWSTRSQTGGLRRVTTTTEEGINVNPSLSGDGQHIAFESTEDLAHAGGSDHFRALRADLASDPAIFTQLGGTRSPAPGISQDGSRIAFAAKEDPLGTNPDGNSEIFYYDGTTLKQITNTTPADPSTRTRDGNFQPSLTDDGRFIAFASNRNLASQNADGNLEIFIYDTTSNTFTQLTNTSGTVGATDAKISGDGTRVAYIRDNGATQSTQRDLVLQDRTGGTTRVLAGNVTNIAFTYGRAISDDGSRVVYAADIATNSSQVFLFDGRTTNAMRQITSLGVRTTEVPLHPTISGDGTRIAFATRRPIAGISNTDNSIELYTYDIPTGSFARVTNAPSTADGFSGSTQLAEVVSSLNDDGSIVAFNFPRVISGAVTSGMENNSEIYVTTTAARPTAGSLTVLNGASFGNEPSTTKAIAPNSIAVALGGALSFTTVQAQKNPDGSFPTTLGGTTVTVNNRSAQILFVSPTQVNFIVPAQTEIGTVNVVVTNSEGFQSRGTVSVLRAAPGIFTISGDGKGEARVLNADTLQTGPFDPSSGNLRLIIFTTGVRAASQVTATAGGRALTVESFIASPDMAGLDEVHVLVPSDLRGAGTVDLVVSADGRASNPATIIFTGDARRDIIINEVLASPPAGAAGDANHDGVRDSSDDEFVELVNTTSSDIDISGFQLLTRSTSSSSDTVRHTFAPGTIFPAGTAIVVFGGGNPNPSDPVFGGAQIFKASSGGLSLTNSGGVVTLRDASQAIVNIFSYGGSTGLNGDTGQSLTRSPDITGNFVQHTAATGSGGRIFSPGTRVDGTPFAGNPIARIDVTPSTATIDAGAKQQFTAHAFNSNGQEITGVIFFWQSTNTAVATIDQTGLATSSSSGSTQIIASGRGIQSAPATLTVRDIQRVLTRIDVTPSTATIPTTGAQQFTAHGFDQFGNEIVGLSFTWASTNTSVATVDQTGLATGVAQGQSTIKATSQNVTGTATLNVTPPTVIINEVLADPPGSTATDLQGDANHDGVRSSSDDEFVEFVNSTNGSISIAGWTLRTRATGSTTETTRHTFATGRTLPAGEAIVVFGGGNFDSADPIFHCAQVVKASSGGLSLTNSGLTILLYDSSGNLITQFAYGGSTGLNGGNSQSLTRSPDITGNFVQHSTATGANGKLFSPGTKVDGMAFGNCPARLTSVTISPSSSSILINQSTQFTAQAFDQFGQPFNGATITFASDNTNAATVDSVTTDPNTGIATATVTGHNQGTAHITAQATSGTTTVNSSQATLTVNSQTPNPTLSINDVSLSEGNTGTTTFTFTVSLSQPAPAGGVTFDIATQDGTATVAGNDYVAKSLTGQTITAGNQTYTFDVTVNGDTLVEPDETFFVNLTNVSGATLSDSQGQGTITNDDTPNLVVSQVYGGGGNSGATYKNDFIELFNRGTTIVDFSVTNYSVQSASVSTTSSGNFGTNKTNLTSGTLAPGKYFLIQEAAGTGGTTNLPTPDATGSIALSATSGKVALVVGTTALSASTCPGDDGASPFNPNNSTIADFVGYGDSSTTAGHCYEGTAPAAAPSNTTADFRKNGGCTDTNDNAADFIVSTPNPRNTSSPANNCTAGTPPDLSINDVTVTEGNSGTVTATFTVSLSAPAPSTDVTFNIATQDNTATTANNDYVAKSLTNQVIPAGQQTYTFSVTVNGDTAIEPDETFFVNVTNVTGANVTKGQGVGTISNDDFPTLSINDVSKNEGNSGTTTFTFTVSLSAPAQTGGVTFDIATQDNTATVADNDYVARSLTAQTIPAGQQTYTFDVTVNGDTNIEPNETFFVNVTNVTGATIAKGQGVGTIQNDDSPTLSINDVSLSEGNSGTTAFTFTVTLSQASNQTVTVDYATANGTATAGSDYQSTSNTLTFNPGDTSKQITVLVNGDTLVEPDETFFVNLSSASGANISTGQGVGTIQNDDTANLVISQVYGGGGLTNATFTNDFVEIFNHGTTTVNFAVTPYSIQYAGATSNFGGTTASSLTTLNSGTIAPGQYFLVQEASGGPVGTALPTPDATGSINLAATAGKVALVVGTAAVSATSCPGDDLSTAPTNPSGNNIVDFVGYGTTASCYEGATGPAPAPSNTTADFRKAGGCTDNNDNANDFLVATPHPRNAGSPTNNCVAGTAPNLTINDVTVVEGNSGTVAATFTVSLSSPAPSTDVTFDIATQNNTATSGSDYTSRSLTGQIIPAGVQTYTFTVSVNGDTTLEPDETFFVNVTNVTGANLTHGQGIGTIQNDDFPTLTINDVAQNEGNAGATTFTFTVSLSAVAAVPVTFDIATADGTAQDGTPAGEDNDYVARSLTGRTIAAGQQTFTFDVTVNGDTNIEPNETFFVNVTNISGATATKSQGVGTIQNDDSPSLSINDVTLNEGNSGTTNFTFNVSLSTASTQTVTVNYATADNTATAPSDYTAIPSTQLTFAPGETIKQVTVQVNGDTTAEGNETFFVNLSTPTNATITKSQGVGTITNDDAAATSADLSVTKTDSPDPAFTGNDITYTITVNNGGPDAAVNAVLADTVPTNTTFRSITSPAGWACSTVPAVGATGSISCSNPSFSTGSSVFTLVVRVDTNVANGTSISNKADVSSTTADSNTDNNSATTTTTVNSPLVITQVYGGGNLSGATYKNDFIEIFNRGKTTVDFSVTPYSVQYADATNSFTTLKTDLTTGTIASGQYFLIQESGGTTNGAALPTPDATGTINLNANSGKVALVLGTTALSGTCPGDDGTAPFNPAGSGVVDFLGYGFGASTGNPNCFEGSARATTASATANARSVMRTVSCTDTNDNAADFTYTNSTGTNPPVARNKATTLAPCP